jgi:uncharacterized membrane protein
MSVQPSSGLPSTEGERESLSVGAAGGAALGSVIALAVASSTVASPVIGAVIGAAGGAALGRLISESSKKYILQKFGGHQQR